MLEYNENAQNTKMLALHYANKVGGELLSGFMGGNTDILSNEEAEQVISGFWKMTDLAIKDSHDDKRVEGVVDIEFWMHKLFNKVGGYMARFGYGELWEKSMEDR